ncbi:hAT transposon superfamily protein, partial [Zea mays]
MIKNFIMNHSMRLSMFNEQSNLKFLAIADTRFSSAIVMLKRFIAIKDALSVMVVSEKWSAYREDNPRQAQFVKKIVNDLWWDKVRYFLSFTEPIYTMIRATDTDKPCLHLIYEMWDTMIEKVKSVIYRHEMKETHEESIFYSAVHDILVSRWTKSNTPLHCLAHLLNSKYYTDAWINEVLNRQAPHNDEEISEMRNTCFRRYFSGAELKKIKLQYANFSLFGPGFNSFDSLEDRSYMEPKMWWGIHGHSAPELKKLALKLLGQPASSSCAERNWSTYGLIHSSLRNRLNPGRAEDLVFTHQNSRLLSRKSDEYRCGPLAMWDVGADTFEADFEGGADFLEQADRYWMSHNLKKDCLKILRHWLWSARDYKAIKSLVGHESKVTSLDISE